MSATIFLFTPPFTQLNTPYPATAYLKGFLNTKGINSFQADLGIEVTLAIFSAAGLTKVFEQSHINDSSSNNAQRIYSLKIQYISTIDAVIAFLQNKQPTLAYRIAQRNYLPEAARFNQIAPLEPAFGNMGIHDKAKYIATLYLEDLADFIKECVDEHFGFSRYAEKLARSANQFDELYHTLQEQPSFTDDFLLPILQEKLLSIQPKLVAISIPFPGNLLAALRCGKYIKQHFPNIKVAIGGGFPNTELRTFSDARLFEFIDFVTLDDGETPLEQLIKYINNEIEVTALKRSFVLQNQTTTYINNTACTDYKQADIGTPDYSDLLLDKYISAIEIINPMHSLWSNGRWNKLTMAHGCYWGKCTFCDISLPYISQYEPLTAMNIVNRMEDLVKQTGENGFHFVDEAAPPALMKAVAIEILRRGLQVSWWTNIRFEKSFTKDICYLLKASGCIGVSGGLEVASDRLLQLIQKGITVEQVAKVNQHFMQAGIMVHAYLMYAFPTQTAQETIDSLEMVRQMFEAEVLQSAYWHRFAMTAHSPVGLKPEKFKVTRDTDDLPAFANNDVTYADPTGTQHDDFGFGLQKALFNYMHKTCLDVPVHQWFEFKTPKTSVPNNYIANALANNYAPTPSNAKIVFIGVLPKAAYFTKSKKGMQWEMCTLTFYATQETIEIKIGANEANWLLQLLPQIHIQNMLLWTLHQVKEHYLEHGLENFELFWDNKPINTLYKVGLLQI